jgi:hypothetical protein
MGEYRPADSARSTVQPWGEHPVMPFTQEQVVAWNNSLIARSNAEQNASNVDRSLEEMNAMRLVAIENDDYAALQELAVLARSRDGFDETDASFFYFATKCDEDIQKIMTYYG